MLDDLSGVLREGTVLAVPVALAAGIVSGLNPCCVSLAPGAAACCGALRREDMRGNASLAAAFVLGGALVTTVFGALAASVGHMLPSTRAFAYVAALIPIVFGTHLLGGIRLPLPHVSSVAVKRAGSFGAFATGAMTSLAMTPCATPALAALLAVAAVDAHPARGASLLFVYGVGLGLPVGLLATTSSTLLSRFSASRLGRYATSAMGAVLILVGLRMLWVA